MIPATPRFVRIAVLVLAACLGAATSTATAAVTTYDDLSSFLGALGELAPVRHEDFDQFDAGTPINDQVSGVVFSSPYSDSGGYYPIQVVPTLGVSSRPNALVGGYISNGPAESLQIMNLDFYPAISAFSFYLTDYVPAATAASVRLEFANESSETLSLSNETGSETVPLFFGATSDLSIVRVVITSGFEGSSFEEFGIDDVRFLAPSVRALNPPVCQGSPADVAGVRGINGTATDSGELETGIQSVFLGEGAVNLTLKVVPFEPGSAAVTFRVTQTNPSLDGQGTVTAFDGEEKSCTVAASFRALGPGPLEGETICRDRGLLLSVSNGSSTPAGTSACSANLPGGDEPAFPPGYVPSDPDDPFPCQVLTIDSPISGETAMILKKDGDFEPNLRMLFSHSEIVGGELVFPPFTDVTEFVEQIATVIPDPTRISGSVQWSPVKVSCATQSEGARLLFCGGLPSGDEGPDADGDGFSLCAASVSERDCNDQIEDVSPDASEICNGLDDNCDGSVDEDTPPAIPCPVSGLLGACRQGTTSCATLPMVCEQTVFPVVEVACNGVDDDCDGTVDGSYAFSGYLPPINPDGSTVFVKKKGAIPVKFQLRTCSGAFVDNAVATIQVFFYSSGVVGDEVADVSSVGSANTGNLFRFDPQSHQYIYNLDASSLQQNASYIIRTVLDDGTEHDVLISIK
ncbi:MAG TPA: MopE-related protein [Candidatus Binatia bacterium]|nr:MopE-related protein [Candidatus Binatia bacterium]